MPCDTVRTTPPVRFGKVKVPAQIDVLQAALESLDYTVERTDSQLRFWRSRPAVAGTYMSGTLTIPEVWRANPDYGEQALRVAFSTAAIRFQAKKYGWLVKETAAGEFEVQRRS